MPWDVPIEYDAAIKWLRARAPMTKKEFDTLTADAKERAFTVSGVAQLDMVAEVHAAIEKAIADGTDFATFKKAIGERLTSAWGGTVDAPGHRLKTIFRTNTQKALAAGRYDQMMDPDVLEARPYWRFDGVHDSRQTSVCRECNDVTLRADDPWWKSRVPPLHHQCRSAIVTLSADEVRDTGVTSRPPTTKADEGFGATPGTEPWTPSRADYPEPLWNEYEAKRQKAG